MSIPPAHLFRRSRRSAGDRVLGRGGVDVDDPASRLLNTGQSATNLIVADELDPDFAFRPLLQIAREFDIDLSTTELVGDTIGDVQAARMANAKPALVRTGDGEYTMQHFPEAMDVPIFDDLAQYVRRRLRNG